MCVFRRATVVSRKNDLLIEGVLSWGWEVTGVTGIEGTGTSYMSRSPGFGGE